jgi:hypothetical protein
MKGQRFGGRRQLQLVAVLLLTVVFSLVFASPAGAKTSTFTASVKIPIAFPVFVSCALGGAGEVVDLSGTLHDVFHTTLQANGSFHVTGHANPQGVIGIGETSGDKYHGTGVTLFHVNGTARGFPFTFTSVNNFRIIGPGPGNNFLVHENTHVTVNANGTMTAFVDNFKVTCK